MNHQSLYLLLGTNLGDKESHLLIAKQQLIKQFGDLIKQSSIYETAAWGNTNQPSFLNQIVVFNTSLLPQNILTIVLDIEEKMGRVRKEKMGPRIIDIDIILMGNLIVDTPLLSVPHPFIAERKFVLKPMVEVGAKMVHPIYKKTMLTLLKECKDGLNVKKFSPTQ